jgi:hypothetical protein
MIAEPRMTQPLSTLRAASTPAPSTRIASSVESVIARRPSGIASTQSSPALASTTVLHCAGCALVLSAAADEAQQADGAQSQRDHRAPAGDCTPDPGAAK